MRHAARLARFATAAGDRRLVGRTFGAWRLDAVLGQGRFGTCFRASRASGEPRSAALKLIKPEQGSLDRDALWREAKALSLCAHPAVPRWLGIVRERDDARDRGRCFMAQSLMPGTSLDRPYVPRYGTSGTMLWYSLYQRLVASVPTVGSSCTCLLYTSY